MADAQKAAEESLRETLLWMAPRGSKDVGNHTIYRMSSNAYRMDHDATEMTLDEIVNVAFGRDRGKPGPAPGTPGQPTEGLPPQPQQAQQVAQPHAAPQQPQPAQQSAPKNP